MPSKVLLTPVDELVNIVKNNNHCSITFLSEQLKIPKEIIEKWLTILEEYDVVNVHYRGLEGFVDFTKKEKDDKSGNLDVDNIKTVFIEKAKLKNLDYNQIKILWNKFIEENEENLKLEFSNKAKSDGYEQNRIDKAWTKYKKELETL